MVDCGTIRRVNSLELHAVKAIPPGVTMGTECLILFILNGFPFGVCWPIAALLQTMLFLDGPGVQY